jgi:hypothetical protein
MNIPADVEIPATRNSCTETPCSHYLTWQARSTPHAKSDWQLAVRECFPTHFIYMLLRKEDNYFGDFLKVAHVVKFGKLLTQLYSGTFHRSYMFRPQRVIIRIILSKTLKKWRYKHALENHISFFGAFEKLRKVTTSFVMSIRPSVCWRGTTALAMDGFSWNLIFEYFFENLLRKVKFY